MNALTQEDIIAIFKESGALLEGHFILRSGLRSRHFFQCARVCEQLHHVETLASQLLLSLSKTIPSFTTVLAPAMGGLVIGQEVARQSKSRFIFAEKVEDKLALRRNFKLSPGEKVLVVEDVITRGGRANEALSIIAEHGGEAVGLAVLVDRSQGKAEFSVPCQSLLQLSFPTFDPENLPEDLQKIPAIKPGS